MLGTRLHTLALAIALRPLDLHCLTEIHAEVAFYTCLYAKAAAVAFLFIDLDYLLHRFHQRTRAKPSYEASTYPLPVRYQAPRYR